MTLGQLLAIIEDAFDGVPQPKDITLHVAEAHDDYDYGNDHLHRKKDYMGKWQDIPKIHLQKCQTALSYVNKVGMRFYLPAYMTWYLRYSHTDEVHTDNTLYALDYHPNYPKLAAYHKERFSLFNPEQLHACALFVKYCATCNEYTDSSFAQKIYSSYWYQFEKTDD